MYRIAIMVLSLIATVLGAPEEPMDWMARCKCAEGAVKKMQSALSRYTEGQNSLSPGNLDDVINEVTEIAHNCTRQESCQCPKDYFKTDDGNHCLKISNDKVDCDEATKICSELPKSRLAVAKDHRRLTYLADIIRHVEDDMAPEHYWIGLSYNRTEGGIPVWTWEDGSKASYTITNNLKISAKKSLIRIDLNGERKAIERVAINRNHKGKHWKQERCGRIGRNGQVRKHKYICEFVMFKLEIKAVTNNPNPRYDALENRAGFESVSKV